MSLVKLNKQEYPLEFNQISDEFEKTSKIGKVPGKIKNIYRIENPTRKNIFDKKESKLKKKRDPNILIKFHGTSKEAVKAIINSGFRLPDKSGMFGRGIYFATNSHKSHNYTIPDHNGYRYILVCRVIIGNYLKQEKANSGLNQDYLNKKGYDSVYAIRDSKDTGGVLHDEFIIYDPDNCLPVFLIKYSDFDDSPTHVPTIPMPTTITVPLAMPNTNVTNNTTDPNTNNTIATWFKNIFKNDKCNKNDNKNDYTGYMYKFDNLNNNDYTDLKYAKYFTDYKEIY